MNTQNVSRRKFLKDASAGTVAAVAMSAYGKAAAKGDALAVLGGSPVRTAPFPAWPPVTAEIEQSLVAALRSGKWGRTLQGPMQGTGLVVEFEKRFAELIGAAHCLATGSCTQSLHTALHAVGVGAGDEVLVAPCTFIASIQAVLMCGALPVFVDVDLDTFQMDPGKIEPLVNGNTRAVEPVHIGGLPCSMEKIMAVAKKHGLKVVEDAAQAHLAEFQGKKCGTFGDLGCFSFQSSKVLACAEGGAIVGNDGALLEQCYAFHNLGLSAKGGSAAIGTKYRMHELEAAVLLPQLATIARQTQTRNDNAAYLARRLGEIPGIVPQKLHEGATKAAYYIYGFRYQKEHFNDSPKQKFLKALRGEKIPFTTMYFDELNKQPFLEHTLNSPTFRKIFSQERLKRYREENLCPSNDQLSAEGVWLPQYVFLGNTKDMDDIADAVAKIHDQKDQLARL
ncbi:MAG: DegT/DnrJ/EryC1/StrS family aminotransferase [Pirellulales bacterium]|nr:DegT/DnrJ/EryC1/StrS family aminotransferase [Pirellulales bacterium]